MRRNLLSWVAALAAIAGSTAGGLIAGASVARAEDAPTAMLIIDASGSMWGRLPPANRPKIDLVREKLGALLATPSSTRVGLISFGHRRRGDCNDVELIAPPGSSRQEILDPIAKLNPKGPGPVTAALKMAVSAIGQSRPAQIVVVGDNADNCQQDSCAAAKEIAANAPGVAVQVIGIGVPANERPRMQCIAEETGGHYYDIADSDGLNAALDEVTKLAMLSPSTVAGASPEAAKPTAPPPPAGASLRASAALVNGGALLTVPLKWRIYKAGATDVLGENQGNDIAAKLSAGDYTIEAELGSIKARQDITIADGDAQSIVLPLNAAHLVARAEASKAGPPSPTAVITVSAGEVPVALTRGGSVDLYLAPANYDVTVVDGAARASRSLSLAAGDDKTFDMPLGSGRLDVSATDAAGAPIDDVLYTVETDDPESANGRREIARSRSPKASFTLPEGTYYLEADSGNGSINKRIALGAGQTDSETVTITLVPVTISALIGGAPAKDDETIFYRVDRIDGDRVSIARAIGPTLALDLSPGRYRISASLATSHLSASQEFAFEEGKPAKAVIDIASGQVSFAPPPGAVPAFGDVYWEVSDASGMPIWRAAGAEATAILAPGRYTVRFDTRDNHGQAAFEVHAGESRKIEMGPG